MASLNLSINGPSIKSSYQGVINGPAPSSSSPTYGQWALFSVQAPLMNAFQDSGSKESILKVESTGEGELDELLEDFSEGRIQFAFVKVKDPNSGLPKNVFIAWCGGGVPERTKGYFTSHSNAVSKVLHGYHVQITARSDSDLAPDVIMKKVSDASGAKYSGGSSTTGSGPPPVAKKPAFNPTSSSSAFNPLVAARNKKQDNVDADGWGDDAPPVTRSEIQKVESAYKPTKVNMADLTGQKQEPSRFNGGSRQAAPQSDTIGGSYQPVGKVDINAIRAAAKEKNDDRPTTVKGAYEPIGKVDIAAIRAKAQKPAEEQPQEAQEEKPKSLSDRSAAFSQPQQSERMTSMPKPKVASKFGGASSFTGTKPLTPGAFGLGTGPTNVAASPVGTASRTFADQGGKTPAQLWAEKKASQGGGSAASSQPVTSPVTAQKSGSEWKSGYGGKKWGSVETGSSQFGRGGGVVEQKTGDDDVAREEQPEEPASGSGVSAMRDRFKNAAPMGQAAPAVPRSHTGDRDDEPSPPPVPSATSRPAAGFQLPGLPARGVPQDEEEEEEEEVASPPVPQREESPARIAVPVPRGPEPKLEPAAPEPPRPVPVPAIEKELPEEDDLPETPAGKDPARGTAAAVAEQSFGRGAVEEAQTAPTGGKRALVQYDYEKAEDNELELKEGEYVTNIEMVDEDWWMGTNAQGESGLFPSNYVELVEDNAASAATERAAPPPPAPAAAEPAPAAPAGEGKTATAQYDYEAAEDNELGFPEGAKVTNLEFPDEDWWFGHYKGKSGLFPSNYVELNN